MLGVFPGMWVTDPEGKIKCAGFPLEAFRNCQESPQ